MTFLTVSKIHKQKEDELILQDITFTQDQFEKIAISGETGSGKSSLLKIIAGYMQADGGAVYFKDERVIGPEEQLIPGHPGIAYLSQHFELRNNYRVEEILEMSNKLTEQEADTIYDVCQVRHLLTRRTDQLSGGEKQRIATARLLIASPKLLLLDEPFSNLDLAHKNTMKKVIHDIAERLQITMLLVSHDPADSLSWADRLIVMKEGKIVQTGTPQELYHKPTDEYTALYLGDYVLINAPTAADLFGPELKLKEKNLFLRPEYFSICSDYPGALHGQIEHIQFMGSYYKLKVKLSNVSIWIHSSTNEHIKGDRICLSLNTDRLWYM